MKKTINSLLLGVILAGNFGLAPVLTVVQAQETISEAPIETTMTSSENSVSIPEVSTTIEVETTVGETTESESDSLIEAGSESVSIDEISLEVSETTVEDSVSSAARNIEVTETTVAEQDLDEASHTLTLEEYRQASAVELAQAIREGKTTPEALIDFAFEMIETTNPKLNNVISLRKEAALAELAAMTDQGQAFYGVPILVKGLGHSIEGGSNSLGIGFMEDQISQSTGRYVKALQEAGFIVIGQTSYPQLGWINVTNSDLYGDTHNPWSLDHNPGGSSGGSAAAVAVGQVPVATTSDAGGSTRIPASWSSLIGLHPSRGILEANSGSLRSQTSHFVTTQTMEDTIQLFETLLKDQAASQVGHDLLNPSLPIAYSLKTPAGTPMDVEAEEAVLNAVDFLKNQGYQLVEVDYPIDGKKMMESYYTIAASGSGIANYQAQKLLGRNLQASDVELLTWALYQTSQVLDPEDVDQAWEYVRFMEREMESFYQKFPLFLTPTTATTAPEADYLHIPEELKDTMLDMSHLSKEERLDLIYQQWLPAWTKTPFTQLANLTGTPALSLPAHLADNGLPLGIQFGSAFGNDRLLLQMGQLFEDHDLLYAFYRNQIEEVYQWTPYEVQYVYNDQVEEGQEKVLQIGSDGLSINQIKKYFAGNNVLSEEIQSALSIRDMIPMIIEVGTKPIASQPVEEDPIQEDVQPEVVVAEEEEKGQDPIQEASSVPALPETGEHSNQAPYVLILVSFGTFLIKINDRKTKA